MFKKVFKFILKIFLWFIGLTIFWVLLYKFVPVPYTPLMAIRSIEGDKNYETRHDWVPIEEICKEIVDEWEIFRFVCWVDAEPAQEKKEQSFESWYGGLSWTDPYPEYETVARLAWEASRSLNEPK